MNVLDYMERYGFEQLSVYTDPGAGLKAFIAVHDTTLGPALGGVRVWPHPTEDAAALDVLRLARGMTHKAAAAGLHFGGGKGLIVADPRKSKTEAMMRAFGRFVETMGGRYITTEDVGMSPRDIEWIAQETSHVTGLPASMGGSGEPSPMTGYGVYMAMKACAKEVWGNESLEGKTVAIQGFGNVGKALASNLKEREEGVKLIVADINETAQGRAREMGARVVGPDQIFGAACDILAPCALGAVLNKTTIPKLKCKVVCGSANNQLQELEDGAAVEKRGILYAPDFIVNAGGIINISCEVGMPYNEESAREKTARIYETVQRVIALAKQEGITTAQAAEKLAEDRISSVRKAKVVYTQ